MNILPLSHASETSNTGSSLMQNFDIMSLFPFVMIFFIFYFLLIKPQMKKQKEHVDTISSLKKGDRILTTGGIIANIVKLEEDILLVEISPEVKIKITKNSVISIYEQPNNVVKAKEQKAA
jgi:preprotein translocase subunit YajC